MVEYTVSGINICYISLILSQKQSSITFLDLKNEFGSIPHRLITDMFQLVGIPKKISNYIQHCYRNISQEWI